MLQKLIDLLSFIGDFQLEMATDFLLEVMALGPKGSQNRWCLPSIDGGDDRWRIENWRFQKVQIFLHGQFHRRRIPENFHFDKNGFCCSWPWGWNVNTKAMLISWYGEVERVWQFYCTDWPIPIGCQILYHFLEDTALNYQELPTQCVH